MSAEKAVIAVMSVTEHSLRTHSFYRTQAGLDSENKFSILLCLIAMRQPIHTGATVP